MVEHLPPATRTVLAAVPPPREAPPAPYYRAAADRTAPGCSRRAKEDLAGVQLLGIWSFVNRGVGKHLPSEQAKRSRISHKFNADLTRMSLLKSNRTREFVTYSALALHSQ